MQKSVGFDLSPGAVLRSYSAKESRELADQWLAVFGGSGAPGTKHFMWHVFGFEAYPSVCLEAAHSQYAQQVAPSFIVLDNDRKQAVETDLRPSACSVRDYFVFPPNMAWTMAFTHEDGWLGPYFAKHRQYDQLNQENLKRIEKALAIEQARQKGWL